MYIIPQNLKNEAIKILKNCFSLISNRDFNNITELFNMFNPSHSFSFGENMPVQLFSRDPERYGFIWNNKRVRLLKTKRNNNPCYYSNAGAISLIRPPYYARFTTRGMLGGTNFEIRIVNTHIRDATREEERILEFNTLVKQVLPRICDLQELSEDGEFMPSYTFLMGDYNLSLNKSERSIYKIEKIESDEDTEFYIYLKGGQKIIVFTDTDVWGNYVISNFINCTKHAFAY